MLNCPSCVYLDAENHFCKRRVHNVPGVCPYAEERKPRNNFEMVKAMSMDELATLINGAESEGRAYGPKGKAAWVKWLSAEVE